jgi:hypothetical protein
MSVNSSRPPDSPPLRLVRTSSTHNGAASMSAALRSSIVAGRQILTGTARAVARSPMLAGAIRRILPARGWMRTARTIAVRSGLALPLLVATSPIAQQIATTLIRRLDKLIRLVTSAAVRAVLRGVSLPGGPGRHRSARLASALGRLGRTIEHLGWTAGRFVRTLDASRPRIRFLHESALVMVIARQVRAFLPTRYRPITPWLGLVVVVGPQARSWLSKALSAVRALLQAIVNRFTPPPGAAAAAAGSPSVTLRPSPRVRPGQRRRHHR